MSWVAVGTAAASAVGGIAQARASRPPRTVMPEPTDPLEVTSRTIAGNRGLLPGATQLAGEATRGTQDIATANMERAIPGFTRLRDMFLERAGENLRDPYAVPAEVEANLGRIAAERGISVGGGQGSQFQGFSALRDFGLNALAFGDSRIRMAQDLMSLATSLTPVVNPVSPISFLVDPNTAIETDQYNKGTRQAVEQGAANAAQAARAGRYEGYGSALGSFASLLQNVPIPNSRKPSGSGDTVYGGGSIPGVNVPPP